MLAWWVRTLLDYQQLATFLDKSHGCMAAGLPGGSPDGQQSAGPCPAASASNGAGGGATAATSEAFSIDIRNVRLLQVLCWFVCNYCFVVQYQAGQ